MVSEQMADIHILIDGSTNVARATDKKCIQFRVVCPSVWAWLAGGWVTPAGPRCRGLA